MLRGFKATDKTKSSSLLKIKSLLLQLADLESALDSFSFEELNADDAMRLKASFDDFKHRFESSIWPEEVPAKTEEEIQRKDPTVGEVGMIIGTVSHEMRTPLNGIIGFADLLQESQMTPEQSKTVNAIQSASRSLLDIINELLEYTKLSTGIEHFEAVDFNFKSVIQEISYLCETLIVDKAVSLRVTIDPEIPECLVGDPSKLSQILLNLLGNAIKFIDEGEILLTVSRKKSFGEKVNLEFVIADTGIGISEKDLSRIFNAFTQADDRKAHKYGGSGLGLHIVQKIVQALEGDITISSRLGKGTTVSLTLPYQKSKLEKLPEDEPVAISAEEIKGLNVLVFEDDKFNQWVIEKRLSAWECTTFITDNAAHGLKLLKDHPVDLILMDLHMPVTDGYEISKTIRNSSDPRISRTPIIAVTADVRIDDTAKCLEFGINDFILKPYTPEDLLAKMVKYKGSSVQSSKPGIPSQMPKTGQSITEENLDLEPVLEQCLGKIELLEELIELYKQNAVEFIGILKVNLEKQDFERIAFAAHKVKAGLMMIPSERLPDIVTQIHQISKSSKEPEELRRLQEAFIMHYPEVEQGLDKALTELKSRNQDGR